MRDLLRSIDDYRQKITELRFFDAEEKYDKIKKYYRLENTWSSNAIEGNRYTLQESQILLEDGLATEGKDILDAQTIIGHAKAYDYMLTLRSKKFLEEKDILCMHDILFDGVESEYTSGKYRDIQVYISGSTYTPPETKSVQPLMNKLIAEQEILFKKYHPIVAAAQFHKELAFIHPFADGNGRIARLAMNCLLIQRSYLPIAIPPMLHSEYIRCGEFTNQVQTCPFNERKGRKRRENSGLVPKEQRKAERCVARASTRLAFRTSPGAARIGRTACAIDA